MFRRVIPRERHNRTVIPVNYRAPQQNRKFSIMAGGGPNFDDDALKTLMGLIGASTIAIIISSNECE